MLYSRNKSRGSKYPIFRLSGPTNTISSTVLAQILGSWTLWESSPGVGSETLQVQASETHTQKDIPVSELEADE